MRSIPKPLVSVAMFICGVGLTVDIARGQNNSPVPPPAAGTVSASVTASTAANYGKLSFTKPSDAMPHHCTATFVENNVLLTAAHCVEDLGTTTKFMAFTFDKSGGGTYLIKYNCIFVPPIWEDQNIWNPPTVPGSSQPLEDEYYARRYDYAFLKTTVGMTGTPNDIHLGNPYSKLISVAGYPDNTFRTIPGLTEFDVLHQALLEMRTTETDFREGTSGAAWVLQSSNKIVSINSAYSYGAYDTSYLKIFGPIFDSSTEALRTSARNCT